MTYANFYRAITIAAAAASLAAVFFVQVAAVAGL